MPITWKIEAAEGRVDGTIAGRFTLEDIITALEGILAHPEYERGFDFLTDHSGVEEPLTTSQMRTMTAHLEGLAERLAGLHWAAVATAPASYGMLRAFSVFLERVPITLRVFRSLEEAAAWLAEPRAPATDAEGPASS